MRVQGDCMGLTESNQAILGKVVGSFAAATLRILLILAKQGHGKFAQGGEDLECVAFTNPAIVFAENNVIVPDPPSDCMLRLRRSDIGNAF